MNDTNLDTELDEVVGRYLDELATALKALPASRRDQLVHEIKDHIADLRAERPPVDLSDLEALLNRVGLPEDIASVALEDEEIPSLSPPKRSRRRVRVAMVVIAVLLFFGLGPLLAFAFGAFDSVGVPPIPAHAPAPIAVPNVIGVFQAQSAAEMSSIGLKYTAHTVPSSAPAGLVVAESPPAGSDVASGSTVSVTVSAGPSS